ncbi:hypothetical protein Tco_1052198 [Tanacetum coccineum]
MLTFFPDSLCPVSYFFSSVTGGHLSWSGTQSRADGILCGIVEPFAQLRNLCSSRGFASYVIVEDVSRLKSAQFLTAHESSRLFITLFPSRSMGGVDTCLHLSLLGLGFILCLLLPQDMVTHTIDTVASVLTQQELDHFCNTYNIPADLGPELPGHEDTIRDAPAGKIGIYTRFLKFANFYVPLSRFLLCVLEYYQINFSQLSVLGAAKVSHFEIMCRVLGYRPSLGTFVGSLPSDDRVNAELLALLDHHRTVIRRYPETFLCLVGLSRSFDDVLVRPTLLKDDESDMGLLDFVKSSDPFKVKTRERTLAEGEIPLNDQTVNMTVPPSAEIVQIVDHTILDEVKEHAGKKKRRVVFEELPAKRGRADAATASVVPTTSGKSPTALKRLELQSGPQGVGSSSVPPPVEEFVSSSVTPTPEPDASEDSGYTQDGGVRTHRASMGVVVSSSSGPDDEVAPPGLRILLRILLRVGRLHPGIMLDALYTSLMASLTY